MIMWEYAVLECRNMDGALMDADELGLQLNRYGRDGCALVLQCGENLVFKRPVAALE